jgi:hypothetical protein
MMMNKKIKKFLFQCFIQVFFSGRAKTISGGRGVKTYFREGKSIVYGAKIVILRGAKLISEGAKRPVTPHWVKHCFIYFSLEIK